MNRENLSVLLPYRRLDFHTTLTTDEAVQLVIDQIIPQKNFRAFRSSRAEVGRFEGVVTTDGFKISRVVGGQNSFKPFLHGHFIPESTGTRINVTMSLHPLVAALVVVFPALWIGDLICVSQTSHLDSQIFVEYLAVIIVIYLIVTTLFAYEANTAKIFLIGLFS